MRINKIGNILSILIFAILSGCVQSEELSFFIVNESVTFPKQGQVGDVDEEIFVILTRDDVERVDFSQFLASEVSDVDFNSKIVVLIKRGRHPNSGVVNSIYLESDLVRIITEEIDPSAGNYIILNETLPYQILSIEKERIIDREVKFRLERMSGVIVAELSVQVR